MSVTPTYYFQSTVRPALHDFLLQPDLRRRRSAALALAHMVDYWASQYARGVKAREVLNAELKQECPDFSLIRDIADPSKEGQITLRLKSFQGHSEQSRSGISEWLTVTVTREDGTTRLLGEVVQSVFAMWTRKIARAIEADIIATMH